MKSSDRQENGGQLVMAVMPKYVGPSCAFLLHLMGYKTLRELSDAYDVAVAGIPGIGPARIRKIEQALNDFGLMMKVLPGPDIPVIGARPHRLDLH